MKGVRSKAGIAGRTEKKEGQGSELLQTESTRKLWFWIRKSKKTRKNIRNVN